MRRSQGCLLNGQRKRSGKLQPQWLHQPWKEERTGEGKSQEEREGKQSEKSEVQQREQSAGQVR